MNIKQANIILKKINRLYETMTLDDKIDVFEQDLMLSYIRQLYEAFSPEELKKAGSEVEVPPIPKIPKQEPASIKKQEPVTEKKPEEEPAPSPVENKPKPAQAKVEPPKPVVEEKPAPKIEITKPKTPAPSTVKSPNPTGGLSKADYDALFDHKEARELSEKLSQMPIKDLTKSMGLNEKIFTINELFGGDGQAFDVAIKTLNTFKSFDQAKAYLSDNIAGKYGWTDKSRKNKAIQLIKLIRRRYN